MRKPPAFFQAIAEDARTRWERREADPEDAGPWHVLFAEVKRPRFVLSELIQNADDAGATFTAARITDDVFEFHHDGEDFDRDAFKALCTFARSSKRRVHSIGLWGIGFKSLFSLGSDVEVITPTLAVVFHENRFSEPQWLPKEPAVTDTVIRVKFRSGAERKRMEGEFVRWRAAPWTLLFLRNVRTIELEGQEIKLEDRGPGPTGWSTRFALGSSSKGSVLVFRSELLPTPEPVLEEVRALRRGATDASLEVSVEVALGTGSDGSVFCGLPTDFKIALPFAINAPFILEPGRESPKDPDVSPTNRWLLGQVGRFVANQLLAWLADLGRSVEERAKAYALLPSMPEPEGEDIADRSARLVRTGLIDGLRGRPIVLCGDGELRDATSALDVPPQLQAVWAAEQLSAIAGRTDAVPVAAAVSPRARDALSTFAGLQRNDQKSVVTWLTSGRPIPRPATVDALQLLWSYLSDLAFANRVRELAILPVEGGDELLPKERVSLVRLDGDLDADLARLFRVRPIVDQAFLANCRAGAAKGPKDSSWLRLAQTLVLGWLGDGVKSVRDALADLGDGLRASGSRPDILAFCKSAFRMKAKLKGEAPFLCEDGQVRDGLGLYADFQGRTDELLSPAMVARTHISRDYITGMQSSEVGEFSEWLWNNHVDRFPPPAIAQQWLWDRKELEKLLRARRGGAVTYRLQRPHFRVTDLDWASEEWAHWTNLSAADPMIWAKLTGLVAATLFARDLASLRVHELGDVYEYSLSCGSPVPAWIAKLGERQSIPLEAGGAAHPAETFRRTDATRHLVGQLPLVKETLDREELAGFWDAVGVRTNLADSTPVLGLLRSLANQDVDAALLEVGRVLDALDAQGFAAEGWAKVRKACLAEALIPAEDKTWQRLGGVVIENPDHLPGCLAIHPSLRKLGVWRRLDVPTRPSRDLVLEWVKGLSEGEDLDRATKERLRSVLQAHAVDVASQLQRWLSMRGHWYRIADFTHVLRGSLSLELFDGVADHIADTSMIQDGPLPEPLDALPDAAASLSTHVDAHGGVPLERPEWVVAATDMLLTVGEADEGDRIVLGRLSDSEWARASSLEVTPYLDGTPAGPPKAPRAAWDDDTGTIYITQDSAACASDVLTEITSKLRSRLLQRVLTQCYDRPRAWVESCLKGTAGLSLGKAERIAQAEAPEAEEVPPSGPEPRVTRASRGRIRTEDQSPPSVAVSAHDRIEAGERVRPLVLAFIRHLDMDVDELGSFVKTDGTIVPSVLDNGVLKLFANGEIAHEAWVTEEVIGDGVTIPAHILPALQRLGERGWIVCREGDGAVFAHPAEFKVYPAEYRLHYVGSLPGAP